MNHRTRRGTHDGFRIGSLFDPTGPNVLAVIRPSPQPGAVRGVVRNTGDKPFTFQCRTSADNGVGDAYAPLALHYTSGTPDGGPADLDSIAVVPGGQAEFVLLADADREAFVRFSVAETRGPVGELELSAETPYDAPGGVGATF